MVVHGVREGLHCGNVGSEVRAGMRRNDIAIKGIINTIQQVLKMVLSLTQLTID